MKRKFVSAFLCLALLTSGTSVFAAPSNANQKSKDLLDAEIKANNSKQNLCAFGSN